MKTATRIFVDFCIVVLLAVFMIFLLYFCTGSLEMMPTEEQQNKAQVVAVFGMIVAGALCAVCLGLRATVLRKRRER